MDRTGRRAQAAARSPAAASRTPDLAAAPPARIFSVGAKLKASQLAGSGAVVNERGETPGAPLNVSVMIGSGGFTIQAASRKRWRPGSHRTD